MGDKISARQAGLILSVILLTNKLVLLPSILFNEVKADGLIITALQYLVDLFLIMGFIFLKKKFPDKSFHEIIRQYLGKILTGFIMIVFCVFFLVKALLIANELYIYLRENVYEEAGITLFFFCLLPVIIYAVSSGLNSLARTLEFFYRFMLFGVIFCIAFALFNIDGIPFFFDNSVGTLAMTFVSKIFWFVDAFVIYFAIDKVDWNKDSSKTILKYSVATMLLYLSFVFVFYTLYRSNSMMHANAISDLVLYSTQFGGFGRIDLVAIITMMMFLYFQFSIMAYGFSSAFESVAKVKRNYSVFLFTILFLVFQYFLVKNVETITWISENVMCYVCGFLVLVVLIVLMLSPCKIKGRKYEKTF